MYGCGEVYTVSEKNMDICVRYWMHACGVWIPGSAKRIYTLKIQGDADGKVKRSNKSGGG
jgi:hypothetical protein